MIGLGEAVAVWAAWALGPGQEGLGEGIGDSPPGWWQWQGVVELGRVVLLWCVVAECAGVVWWWCAWGLCGSGVW